MTIDFWRTRTKADAVDYWNTRAAGYRAFLASLLGRFAPFDSVLEIGCHAGANLWAIRQQWPKAHLIGLDPSPACAEFAGRQLLQESRDRLDPADRRAFDEKAAAGGTLPSLGVDIFVGKAPDALAPFKDIGVIVTCYALAYLNDEDLAGTLTLMLNMAKNGLLIVEPMPTAAQPAGPLEGRVPSVCRDYQALVGAVCDWPMERKAFPGPQALTGALLVHRPPGAVE